MKLHARILLLVLFTTALSGTAHLFLMKYQENALHEAAERSLAHTLIRSLSVTLAQDILDKNTQHVTELLRRLANEDDHIDYLYVTEGDHSNIFSHSFATEFPQYLIGDPDIHQDHTEIQLTHAYDTDRGVVFEYAEAIVEGSNFSLHIGSNQSYYAAIITANVRYIVEMGMVVLVLSLLIGSVWSRSIIRPLLHFTAQLNRFAQGKGTNFNNVSSVLEIRQLATVFEKVITQRQDAFTRVQEQEQNLAITLNSIGDAVITTDADGNVTRMNPVAEALTGWSLQDAEGQSLKTIFSIVDASTRLAIANPVDLVLATGETVYLSNHTTLIARDGTEHQIADSAAPIRNGDDRILGMVLVFNDVTEAYRFREDSKAVQRQLQIKESEQRGILNAMVDAVITIDEMGKMLSFNNSAEILFGYKNSEVIGENIKMLMPESYSVRHDGYLGSYMTTGESHIIGVGRDVSGLHKNKKTFPMRLSISELPRLDDGMRRFIGTCHDLTQRNQKQDLLNRSQKMEALGHLTGGIAHDYNNMLGVILGYSDLLTNLLVEQPKLKDYAMHIHHAGQRGAKLTKKLLSFSSSKLADAKETNINSLLREDQDLLQKTLTVRIKLVLDLADDLWPVFMDPSELDDAILNMSINAMHAMKKQQGEKKLTIRSGNITIGDGDTASLGLAPGDYVQLSIIDTGMGMDDEVKEKIFNPFFTTKGDKGTGLGLSQVFGFVKRTGGNIKVYSEEGHGAQFVIYFPRFQGDKLDENREVGKDITELRGDETILVVDDEEVLRFLCSELLGSQGYHVICAASALEALEILEQESIDLVLSDVIMGGMDGYQLAAIIQENYPAIKIQLASGFTDDRHVDMIDEGLHENLLYKPYKSQELFGHIRSLLDGL